MSRRVLVTGAAGYIGSHFVKAALVHGYEVLALDDLSTGNRWAVPESAPFFEGDFADSSLVESIHRSRPFEAVVHFAAKTSVEESVREPALYYDTNTVKTVRLLRTLRNLAISRFVFSSTCAVYGEPAGDQVSETDPLRPSSPYGASKAFAERILTDVGGVSRMKYAILRYFNVAGAHADGSIGPANSKVKSLIKLCCEAAVGIREEVVIHGNDYSTKDGTGARDYIHVEDLSSAHLELLRYLENGGPSEIFNCGYGRSHTVREVIASVERVSGIKLKVVVGPRRAGDIGSIYSNAAKIRATLDWLPRFEDLDSLCRSAYRWECSLRERKAERE